MQKRIALLVTFLLFTLALTPALCQADDETAGSDSLHAHLYHHLFAVTDGLDPFDQNRPWTGLALSADIPFRLPQSIPSASATRAPPA